jgi:hypothetical protein
MKARHYSMHPLRLAYATQFLIALIAVCVVWRQVGGQSHFEALPWYTTAGLIAGVSFAAVKATAEAVSHESAWNPATLKWCAILAMLLVGCGMASLYSHNYLENDEPAEGETVTSSLR